MDYSRIYSEFIADRKAKPQPEGYSERHHILPRCMGGGDEAENLIALTAEDHYFAHLLLARVHGGKLISALWRMLQCSETTWGRKGNARRSYGLAKRMIAKHLKVKWTADGNPLFNETEFDWVNYRSGERRTATLYAMHEEFGGGRPTWTQAANGSRPSAFGWVIADRLADHVHSEKGQSFRFVNRDGREFVGTQGEFCKFEGVGPATACRIVRQQSVSLCGWRLAGTPDRIANMPKDGRRGAAVGTGRTYRLRHRDGRGFVGNAEDFRKLLGKPEGFKMAMRLSGLRRGTMPTLYGWSIGKEDDARRAQYPMGGALLRCARGKRHREVGEAEAVAKG